MEKITCFGYEQKETVVDMKKRCIKNSVQNCMKINKNTQDRFIVFSNEFASHEPQTWD